MDSGELLLPVVVASFFGLDCWFGSQEILRRGGWVSLVAVVLLVEGQVLPVEVRGIMGLVVLVLPVKDLVVMEEVVSLAWL